jgi:predicted esterase/outer membrane protein assembly factor BamD (BamD/ComL family)
MRRDVLLGMGLAACALLAGWASEVLAAKPTAPSGPVPTFDLKPGQNRVEPPGGRPYLIYVPTDYTPDRAWPLIIYMHGTGGAPSLGQLREMFGGKTFIIVGHEYMFHNQAEEDHAVETANLKYVVATVQANLKVDPKQMFLGGFSQGGWWTTMLSEYTIDLWAGLFTIASGEHASGMPTHANVKGKPIHIIAGMNDKEFYAYAQVSVENYTNRGAAVSYEWIPGFGHSDALAKNEKLKEFLLNNGPLKAVKANLAAAKAARTSGRLGEAYMGFSGIASLGSTVECAEAAEAAKAIATDAEKLLADGKAAIDAKKYADAVKAYGALAASYAGSPFAEKAKDALKALESDPAIAASLVQARLDAEAATLEGKAQVAEAAKDYAVAIKLYEQYVATYPQATRAADVKAHLEALKKDPAIMGAAREKEAERDCKSWLQMADNYAGAGRADKAREYLQKILDTYPGTSWAAKAKDKLARLGPA